MVSLYEFEATTEAAPTGGEPVAEAEPTPEPEPVEPETPEEGLDDAALSRGFDETSPEFRQAVAEEAEAVVQAQLARVFNQPQFQPPIPGATPGPMGFDWTQVDPYADDFGAQLGQGIQATIQAALETSLGPVTQTLEQAQEQQILARGEEVAQDMLADVIARKGDISERGKAQARQRADAFMHETAARYGETPRAAELAIEMAYDEIAAYEQEIAAAAVAKHNNYTATLAGVPGEPGTAVAGVAGQPARPLSPGDLARKYSASA